MKKKYIFTCYDFFQWFRLFVDSNLELVDRRGFELVDCRGPELVDPRDLELVDCRGPELVDPRDLKLVDPDLVLGPEIVVGSACRSDQGAVRPEF